MYRVLIADDNREDRELLKLEITRALKGLEEDLRFHEAQSVRQALDLLGSQGFDLLTLDIEFDKLNEGIDVLPDIFERYPSLGIIIVSGKLNKAEITERLFRFTKDNVLKGKRWRRHFDVLDKKDDKSGALQSAYRFTAGQKGSADKLKDLFLQAEAFMEAGDMDRCREVYQRIQELAPGEPESIENIRLFRAEEGLDQALEYMRRGDRLVAALLLGHHLEIRLKGLTRKLLGRAAPGLYDCLKELERARRITPYKKALFQQMLKTRNKAVHHPSTIGEEDFEEVRKAMKVMEANY